MTAGYSLYCKADFRVVSTANDCKQQIMLTAGKNCVLQIKSFEASAGSSEDEKVNFGRKVSWIVGREGVGGQR